MKEKEVMQPMFSERVRIGRVNAFNVEKILSKAASYWPLFLFSLVITLSLGYLYLRYKTPVYMVSAKIMINDQRKGMSDMDLLQDLGMRPRPANVDNEMEVIKSITLMQRVVAFLDLNIQYTVPGTVTQSVLYEDRPISFLPLFADSTIQRSFKYDVIIKDNQSLTISNEKKTWNAHFGDTVVLPVGPVAIIRKDVKSPVKELNITISPVESVASSYNAALLVSNPNRLMSIVNLSVTDVNPERGKDVLNTLIQVYMQSNIDDRNRVADGTMEFINDRLVLVSSELTGIEKEIEGFKKANELTDIQAQSSMLLTGAGDYTKQLNEQEIQLSLIEALEKYLRDNSNNRRIVPATLFSQDAVLVGIITKYNELQAQREKMLLTNTESSPYIVNIDQQLANLRGDMLNSLVSIKHQLQVSLGELRKMSGRLDAQIRQVPAKERVFLEYSRQQNIKQELYLFLLKKREETAISKSATTSDAKIIDAAKKSGRPVSPNRKVVFLSAIVFGLLLPSAGIFIKDVLNIRVSSKEDIEQVTKMSVLAEIGHSDNQQIVAVKKDSRSQLSEQFRGLRTNLQFMLTDGDEKVIMVTSSMSGEGKSFISINLAGIMAVSDKKVLLMELDLRKPKISVNLGIRSDVGFSNYAIGQADLDQIILPSGVFDNFYVMPSGPIPPNPAELIMLPKIRHMFDVLKKSFDYIIVDTAPVGLVTDAQLLASYSDTVLYLVRQDYTFKQQLHAADELYRSGKMPSMSLVINDVKNRNVKYGYGYGYGYYGNGYFEQEDEGTRFGKTVSRLKRKFRKKRMS